MHIDKYQKGTFKNEQICMQMLIDNQTDTKDVNWTLFVAFHSGRSKTSNSIRQFVLGYSMTFLRRLVEYKVTYSLGHFTYTLIHIHWFIFAGSDVNLVS